MFLKKETLKSKYRHLLKRGLAFVLCIASLCSFMVGFSEIDAFATDSTNAMMLHLSTGNMAGDRVQYFKVRYKDTSGNEHTQIVHPKESKTTSYGKILNVKSGYYGTYQRLSESLSKITGDCTLCDYSYETLRQYTEDYLIFETDFAFSSLMYIEVFVNYSSNSATGKNEWTCQNLELIKLKSVNGFTFAGVISGEPIPEYEGTVVARKTKAGNFAWASSANDKVYRMSFTSTSDDTKLSVPTKTSVSTSDYRYSLEFDIADVNGAGLEDCISPVKITNLNDILGLRIIDEHIILSLTYPNDCGGTSVVEIPLLLSYLFSIYKQNNIGSTLTATTPVDGVFRQGDTIGLTCLLPNITDSGESSIGFSLKYVDDNKDCSGLINVSDAPKTTYTRKPFFDNETFRISALRIYKATSAALTYSYDSNTSTVTHNEMGSEPIWAYVATTSSGLAVTSGSTISETAARSEAGSTAKHVPKNVYVVSFTTDTVKGSESSSNMKVSIKYTQKGTGAELTTSAVDLKTEASTYYGYWTFANKVVDTSDSTKFTTEYQTIGNSFEYVYGLSKGNTISFFIQIENVDSFKSVDVKVDGTDDWQIKKIEIAKAKDYGERTFAWKDTSTVSCNAYDSTTKYDFYSDRIITRKFSSTPVKCVEYTQQVLITGGHTGTIDFTSGKVSDSDNEESYSHSTNFISYENTKKNFGFAKTRCKYKVEVQVANDLNTGVNYGDCGSINQFYFQLVFEDGKSAYVLANQQLSADGFRTGMKEEFIICTNRNYGELKAIHIIPEDPNSDEDDFDKLKISYISVSKVDNSGLSHVWKVEINDWISIDYEDDDENNGYKGQQGRTESELARTYIVTSNTFKANFMMAITTANVDVGTKQLSGNISGSITYIDTTNIERTLSLKDITTDIFTYNGTSVVSKVTIGTTELAAVDQSCMALPGHTDRFYFSIDSVKKIESLTLTVQSDKDVQWEISGVSISLVKSEGNVVYNELGEYVNTGNKEFICSWPTEGSVNNSNTVIALKDGKTSATSSKIVFSDNLISIENEGEEYTTSITSVPQSEDDSINVYVYMADGSQAVGEYNMIGAIQYTNKESDSVQKSIRLNADSRNNNFYKIGISSPGLTSVKKMMLQAADSKSARVDYAIVEHMRSGVLIETVKFTYAQGNAKNVLSANGLIVSVHNCEEQIITFQTTDDSDTINLTKDADDIAVSITYESSDGTYTNTVTSVNTFLTDHNVSTIEPGRIYNVALYQYHIKSIKSINFIAMGKVIGNVGIRNAYVTNKKYGTTKITNWSSFGKGIKPLSATTRSIAVTDTGDENGTVVSKITMSIKTAASTENFDSGTSSKIKMKLGYYDPSDQVHYLVIDDIRPYIIEGETFADKTAKLSILVTNLKSLRSVEFTPISTTSGEDASWMIESITSTVLYQGVENSSTRIVNASADEGETISVNISDVEILIPAYSYNLETKSAVNNTFTNRATTSQGMVITGDRTITFSPEVTGSTKGVSVHCYRVVNNADIACDEILTITKKDGIVSSVLFNPLKVSNYTGYFKLVFQSDEFSQYNVTLHITVEASTFIVVDNSLGKRIIGTSSKNPTLEIYTGGRIKLYPKVYGASKTVTYKCFKTVDGTDVLVNSAVTKINPGASDEYINFDPSINSNSEGTYKIVFTVDGDSSITATVPIKVKQVEETTAAS